MTVELPFPWRWDSLGQTDAPTEAVHVREMIEQFLLTGPGERVNRPDFGSGLLQMVFAPIGPDTSAGLQLGIRAGLLQWLGDLIDVSAVDVVADAAALAVTVAYVLRATGQTDTVTVSQAVQ